MTVPDLWLLAVVAALSLLLAGALAPFEALGWWAGWFGRRYEEELPVRSDRPPTDARHVIVFLSGIHSVSGQTFANREKNFLQELHARLPEAEIVEVFPYSVTNRALTAQRLFSGFWRWALRMKLRGRALTGVAGLVINLRNGWQVAVSADRRYGPIYNQGSAELIYAALLSRGFRPGSGVPVTLVGYSGGGQVAVGAAGHLRELIGGPVQVVSLGGVIASDPGLDTIDRLYHLVGEHDRIERLSHVFFPGRWPLLPYSSWNQARKQGRIAILPMGPVDHTGRHGYLDSKALLPDGRSHLQATVDTLVAIVRATSLRPSGTRAS